ncbi:Cytochrome P450 (chloroplast) [Artemisia annua]|uniref:Cytochrome P450 n=1 Tax=Artemisia annua TaxID=35608 RepID=A0A2U1PJW7_ARTAN|nr:Cytochrome P450 [Artemisia annua]
MDIHTRLDALLERVLREHQEARKQKKDTGKVRDLLDILLDISEDENMEMKLTTNSIKAFILDVFLAELISIIFGWLMSSAKVHSTVIAELSVQLMESDLMSSAGKDGNLNSVDMEEGIGLTLPRANPLVCVPAARLHPIPLSV